jgi:hypothetical protein
MSYTTYLLNLGICKQFAVNHSWRIKPAVTCSTVDVFPHPAIQCKKNRPASPSQGEKGNMQVTPVYHADVMLCPSLLRSQRHPAMVYSFNYDDTCIKKEKENGTLKTKMRCIRPEPHAVANIEVHKCHHNLHSPRLMGNGGQRRSLHVRHAEIRMIDTR